MRWKFRYLLVAPGNPTPPQDTTGTSRLETPAYCTVLEDGGGSFVSSPRLQPRPQSEFSKFLLFNKPQLNGKESKDNETYFILESVLRFDTLCQAK
jgi:hypothetical protein